MPHPGGHQKKRDCPHAIGRREVDGGVVRGEENPPPRRYETANGLATDIHRYLNNEPVTARPPSNLYRFQKLVRRNKTAFAAVAAVAAALGIGPGVSLFLFICEREAHHPAVAAGEGEARPPALAEGALGARG